MMSIPLDQVDSCNIEPEVRTMSALLEAPGP